ncbi:hypothetical protein E4U17_006211 [Claviceps sp. LM77 group G4]|nr:hypothetical protein E4U17_006211 [Claviceps sp. LM77 group G4]KAG6083964.1 hypothetical protein E4U33_004189 [Claviceps sp. LM78 group G4]
MASDLDIFRRRSYENLEAETRAEEERRQRLATESNIEALILGEFAELRHDASIVINLPTNLDESTTP